MSFLWFGSGVPDKLEPMGTLEFYFAAYPRTASSPEPPEHLGQADTATLKELGLAWEGEDGNEESSEAEDSHPGTD